MLKYRADYNGLVMDLMSMELVYQSVFSNFCLGNFSSTKILCLKQNTDTRNYVLNLCVYAL